MTRPQVLLARTSADGRLAAQKQGLRPMLDSYFKQISATPLLGAREERETAWRVIEGDAQARDRMVRSNLRLVVSIARGYLNKGLDLSDLISEGNLGLLRAVEAFDPGREVRFCWYAAFWIKQSIRRALTTQGKPIRLPGYAVTLIGKWQRATANLQETLGRKPNDEEVAANLNLSPQKLTIISKAIRIYNAMPEQDSGRLVPENGDTDTRSIPGEDLQRVLGLLAKLDQREAFILRLRFGLEGQEPHTLNDIGKQLGLTRERVRQIQAGALGKLRETIENMDLSSRASHVKEH